MGSAKVSDRFSFVTETTALADMQ